MSKVQKPSIRDESTPENKAIWKKVDNAAKQAPEWVIVRLRGREELLNKESKKPK